MNGVSERGHRGESLTNNLLTLKRNGKLNLKKITAILKERDAYVCYDYILAVYKGYCPGENVLDRMEPVIKDLIEERGLKFDDWRIGFKF